MNCQEAKELIFAFVKSELDEKTHSEMQSHLDVCETCRKEVDDVRAVLALVESASDEKVINMVNDIIYDAINSKADLIHFESEPDGIRVRIRRYGVLHESAKLFLEAKEAVAARIKLMANINVSERRIPQDGVIFSVQAPGADQKWDIRVNCAPTVHGESFVMCLLDRSNILLGLDKLDISPTQLSQIYNLLHRKKGWIITTGPNASGKTTMLYSMLMHVNSDELKTITIEDPVEYLLKGATQIQVHKKVGLTFAAGLQSILRHDPDIIMTGETPDWDSAIIATKATLAGHLVLSTLLTNDAPSAIIRLMDMGLEPFLITSAVTGIVAQRLARRVCNDCREEYTPAPDVLDAIGFTLSDVAETKFYRGKGCDKCSNTGYVGRTLLLEVMIMNQELAKLLDSRSPLAEIRECAIANGMITMAADARQKIKDGITTVEEAARVLEVDPVM